MLSKYPSWFLRYQLALIYWDRDRADEARQLLRDCGHEPAYAPFYAWRAAVAVKGDSSAILHDLERAASLDGQWRYNKLLAEYYILHDDPVKAGAIAGKFYQAHPDNYIMGMLYARTLLANHSYAACDKLLASLNIIPFEGATIGRELYRETKLMLAVQEMKKHSYKKALARIDEGKQWPEHLGVGAPYPEDQDLRLENWMSYRCYAALGQDKAARAALEKIPAEWARTLSSGGQPDKEAVRAYLRNGKESNGRVLDALDGGGK
jgi:hypothetical protein